MTRDEMITAVAEVLAGLQVPVSMGMPLGQAEQPWRNLHGELPSGWHKTAEYEAMLRDKLTEPVTDWVSLARDMIADDDTALRKRVEHLIGPSVDPDWAEEVVEEIHGVRQQLIDTYSYWTLNTDGGSDG